MGGRLSQAGIGGTSRATQRELEACRAYEFAVNEFLSYEAWGKHTGKCMEQYAELCDFFASRRMIEGMSRFGWRDPDIWVAGQKVRFIGGIDAP